MKIFECDKCGKVFPETQLTHADLSIIGIGEVDICEPCVKVVAASFKNAQPINEGV